MGPPETAQLRATLPVKPPVGVIVMVEVPLGPGDAMVTAVLLSVKPGAAGTTTVKLELVTEKLPLALVPGATVTGLLLNEKGCCGTKIPGLFVESDGALLASPG
jgi:hypothetical protein